MYHIFFIYSSVDGHLGCFHVLPTVNSAAVNPGMHIFFELWFSLDICLGLGLCMCVCIHVKLLHLCLTLCNPMDYSPPVSSVYGIL